MHLAIYGEGGLGHEVLDLVLRIQKGENQIIESIFFIVDDSDKSEYMSYPIVDFEEIKRKYKPGEIEFIIALGEPEHRKRLYERVKNEGYGFKTLIHPSANISPSASIGEGTIIQYCTSISSDTKIGDNCFFQASALIGHDCLIRDHCVVSSHVAISGHVSIGEKTYIAPGVMVKDRVNIGFDSVIGMGAIVQRDIPDNVIALGNPARPMKHKDENKIFK